jgi:putative ABC transport system ATP-binding protein
MIELKKATRRFTSANVQALHEIDLKIERGEFVTIMGPSGSGKTTLLQILGTLDSPDSGAYLLEGHDITSLTDRELSQIRSKHFGFVFQSFHLLADYTCYENVMMPLIYSDARIADRKPRVLRILESVGLSHRLHHYPAMLSGGEQQRIAIARSVINNPSLVLADEPTGNLPSHTGKQIMEIFSSLNIAGVTLVIVTHDERIADYGNRRIRIEDGRIVFDSLLHNNIGAR